MWETLIYHTLSAVVFSVLGLVVFGIALWLFTRFSPFSVRKEIEEDQNVALGIIVGAMLTGISIIIAAAVHG